MDCDFQQEVIKSIKGWKKGRRKSKFAEALEQSTAKPVFNPEILIKRLDQEKVKVSEEGTAWRPSCSTAKSQWISAMKIFYSTVLFTQRIHQKWIPEWKSSVSEFHQEPKSQASELCQAERRRRNSQGWCLWNIRSYPWEKPGGSAGGLPAELLWQVPWVFGWHDMWGILWTSAHQPATWSRGG